MRVAFVSARRKSKPVVGLLATLRAISYLGFPKPQVSFGRGCRCPSNTEGAERAFGGRLAQARVVQESFRFARWFREFGGLPPNASGPASDGVRRSSWSRPGCTESVVKPPVKFSQRLRDLRSRVAALRAWAHGAHRHSPAARTAGRAASANRRRSHQVSGHQELGTAESGCADDAPANTEVARKSFCRGRFCPPRYGLLVMKKSRPAGVRIGSKPSSVTADTSFSG